MEAHFNIICLLSWLYSMLCVFWGKSRPQNYCALLYHFATAKWYIVFGGRIRNNVWKPVTQSPVNQHTCNLIGFFCAMGEARKIKKKSIFRKLAKFWKKITQKFSRSEVRLWNPFAAPVNPLLRNTFLQLAFVFGTPPLKNQRTSNFLAKFYCF